MKKIKLPTMACKQVCGEIGDFVIETVLQTGSSGCVIGLSGGVDSSTAAALIKTGLDRHNAKPAKRHQELELVGYILPSRVNPTQDEADAEAVARSLGIRYEIHRIENLVESFQLTNPEAFESKFHKGNMISRIRANVLSTKAATGNKILAGTGNRDEDFGIGYYTLFGDGAVHLSPIAGLPKRVCPSGSSVKWPPSWLWTNRSSSANRLPDWNRARVILKTWDMIMMSWNSSLKDLTRDFPEKNLANMNKSLRWLKARSSNITKRMATPNSLPFKRSLKMC